MESGDREAPASSLRGPMAIHTLQGLAECSARPFPRVAVQA